MIGNTLKKYRKRLRLTQEMLAQELGVTKQYISKIERAIDSPNIELCYKIKKYFEGEILEKSNGRFRSNISIEQLFYEIDD